MPTAAYRALFNLAEDQMGHVTTAQASSAGVRPMTLVMMTKRGTLERISRGVYRLVDFPEQPLSQYMQATLWPYARPGVLSHETALSLYEMSDIHPAKVHITVPADFRIQREIPEYLTLHREDLEPHDVTRWEGMPVTTPERTIRDCIKAQLGPTLLTQAIEQARLTGRFDAQTQARLLKRLRTASNGEGSKSNASTRVHKRSDERGAGDADRSRSHGYGRVE